ncbi:MAG: glycoside hydrolase family 9 protein [Phycisphaeraceae bacterium]
MNRFRTLAQALMMMTTAMVGSPLCADGLGGREIELAALPPHLLGATPIDMPTYKGVDQLLVLSDRWVIVVTSDMDKLFDEIDRRSNGELRKVVDRWVNSEAARKPDWDAYHARGKIRDAHIAAAREAIGERRLAESAHFAISSQDDPRYIASVQPARADRLYISTGQNRSFGGVFEIEYAHYSYLELPQPMQDGKHYRIALAAPGGDRNVAFVFDRMRTVSRAIKVNQLGYLPNAGRKLAYMGAHLYKFGPLDLSHADRFEVVSVATGKAVFSGAVKLIEADPRFAPTRASPDPARRPRMYGENVYELDFTGLKETGAFFISVPGVGRSWPFRHDADVYGEGFFVAMRGLYHQRAGVPLTEPFTPWTRDKASTDPVYESKVVALPPHVVDRPKDYDVFDIIGGSIDRSRQTDDVAGGWHDAADWDRNLGHYAAVFDLLNAFELAPQRFSDGQLRIPESGNGIPDILDEAEFGLRVWKRSMDERGGVSGMVETWTHPRMHDTTVNYVYSVRTRWSSLIYAAAAAQLAQLVKPYDAAMAGDYAQSALKAYRFGTDEANSLGEFAMPARKNRGQGEPYTVTVREEESYNWPYLIHARTRLYLLTGEAAYLEGMAQLAAKAHQPMEWRFSHKDWSVWIYYSIIQAGKGLPEELVRHWQARFLKNADTLVAQLEHMPYRITWPREKDGQLAWGSSTMTNYNRLLAIALQLTSQLKYRDAMIANIDFMLGANPMGMSWTTGLGLVYPIDLQHEVSETDGIWDPVPGLTLYGVTGGPIYHQFRQTVWQSPSPEGPVQFAAEEHRDVPLWRSWMVHPHVNVGQCEFTVGESLAATAFSTAMLASDRWQPEPHVLERQPRRQELLFGRWYLP